MSLAEILKKAAEGGELTSEEKNTLKEFKPEGIPKSRLDAEIVKRKELEQRNSELSGNLHELSARIEELESRDMSEAERLKKTYDSEVKRLQETIKSVTEEKNAATRELETIQFRKQVSDLAGKYQFTDSDYLGFLVEKEKISLGESEQVEKFIDGLKISSPKHFKLDIGPGGGSLPGKQTGAKLTAAGKSGDIVEMLASAPVIQGNI